MLAKFDQTILDLVKSQQYKQALWVAEESYAYARGKYGEIHMETAKTMNNLAWLYDLSQRQDVAETHYLRALEVKKTLCGNKSTELLTTMENLNALYMTREYYDKSLELLLEMIDIVQVQPKPWFLRKAVYLSQLADIKKCQGNLSAAESLYHRCAAFIESSMTLDHPNLGRVFANIADFYTYIKNYPRAQVYYNRAYAVLTKNLSKKHPDVQYVIDQMNMVRSLIPESETGTGKNT